MWTRVSGKARDCRFFSLWQIDPIKGTIALLALRAGTNKRSKQTLGIQGEPLTVLSAKMAANRFFHQKKTIRARNDFQKEKAAILAQKYKEHTQPPDRYAKSCGDLLPLISFEHPLQGSAILSKTPPSAILSNPVTRKTLRLPP